VSVGKQRIDRCEQPPGRIAVKWRRADLPLEIAQCIRDLLWIRRVREVRRHVVERGPQCVHVGAQLLR
jgi:hypothetical protein